MHSRWNAGAAVWLAAAQLVLALSCGGGASGEGSSQERPTRSEVFAAVVTSTAPDTDGDGLPDDVETRYAAVLGTDPARADCDGDGVIDAIEVFGGSWLYLQTRGATGLRPGAEPAGYVADPALPHDAESVDSDGDGVPDVLEYVGYRYDWMGARFVMDPAGVHTDPLQWSTDQDAYSDATEVSGLNMDVAVLPPGDHPLVPAYPDISVELQGYTVTLNETIEYSNGGEIERGTSWSREFESTHTFEFGSELSTTVGADIGVDLSFSFEVSSTISMNTSDTVAFKASTGGTASEKSVWNRSRTANPTDAARLKLYAKVRNLGTAPASNVVPTLSLRIGGADVATFEPPNLSVAMLLPGGVFPPEEGVHWVLDAAAPDLPLSLTDWELRALESGAPVTMSVAQKRTDVMRLDDAGAWQRVGDANDYLARILSVTADLFADVGAGPDGEQGNLLHSLVAADDTPTAPVVTLGEALGWSMGFRRHDDGRYSVDLPNRAGGTDTVFLRGTELDDRNWRWEIDPLTMARNWLVPPPHLTLADVLGMRLGPGSQIALRAPRQLEEVGPFVHSAYAERTDAGYQVTACVSDYDGIARVVFVDANVGETELVRDGRGPWFFSGLVGAALVGTEKVRAESTRTVEVPDPTNPQGPPIRVPLTTEVPIAVIYSAEPQPPVIGDVVYTPAANEPIPLPDRLYAKVEPAPGGLASDIVSWVRVYHPYFLRSQGADEDGYVSLSRVTNTFEDPNGWERRGLTAPPLPPNWLPGMRLVAATTGMRYTIRPLDGVEDFRAYRSGHVALNAMFDYTADDEFWNPETDLDRPPPPPVVTDYTGDSNTWGGVDRLAFVWKIAVTGGLFSVGNWTPADGMADVYLRDSQKSCPVFLLGFFVSAMKAPYGGDEYYESLSRLSLESLESQFVPGYVVDVARRAEFEFRKNDVFLFRTTDRDTPGGTTRLGKLIVRNKSGWGPSSSDRCGGTAEFAYTIFANPGDP